MYWEWKGGGEGKGRVGRPPALLSPHWLLPQIPPWISVQVSSSYRRWYRWQFFEIWCRYYISNNVLTTVTTTTSLNFLFNRPIFLRDTVSEDWLKASQPSQEPLLVKDKVWRPSDELGVSKSVECDTFSFSALTLLVWRQEGHLAYKKLGGLLLVTIWLELCTSYSASCHHHLYHP